MHQTITTETSVAPWRPSIAAGLRTAVREWRLVLLVWGTFLLVAAFAMVPTWRGFQSALAWSPEGDRLIGGLNLPLLMEMIAGDGPSTQVTLPWMVIASLLVALAWNPFVAGGVISVLGAPAGMRLVPGDPRAPREPDVPRTPTVRERFFAGGARHYWSLVRLLGLFGLAGGLVLLFAGAVLTWLMTMADDRDWEQASLALFFVTVAVLAALAALISLTLDFARVALVRDGQAPWPAMKTGLRLLTRHGGTIVAFGLGFALLLLLAGAIFLGVSRSITFAGWATIVFGIVLQQGFALARTALRVAMIGGALRMLPVPPAPAPPAPAPPVPVWPPVVAPEAAPPEAVSGAAPESAPGTAAIPGHL